MARVSIKTLAPDFELVDYRGEKFRLSDHRGKNILLVFNRGFA